MPKRVLVVEDDRSIACVLRDNLLFEGFDVEWAPDGEEGLHLVPSFRPDLVLLDLKLPGLSGFEVCQMLRGAHPETAIVILTVRDGKEEKMHGFELGADDYVTKPFDLEELLARVHAVLRRTGHRAERLVLGDTVVDFRLCTVERDGRSVLLTQRELDLLRYLAENLDRVVSREELLRAVWGYRETVTTRTVDNFIVRLRRKIESDPKNPTFLHTAYGDGYRLTASS